MWKTLGGRALTMEKIAEAQFDLKNYDKSLEVSQKVAEMDQRAGLLDQLADDEFVEGRSYFALGDLKDARSALEDSISNIEQLRNNVSGGAAERKNFMASKTDSFSLAGLNCRVRGRLAHCAG